MKPVILISMMLSIAWLNAQSQNSDSTYGKNYWVTEAGCAPTPYTKIRFYTHEHVLLKELSISGRKINFTKRSKIRRLNKLLSIANVETLSVKEIASTLMLKPSIIGVSQSQTECNHIS